MICHCEPAKGRPRAPCAIDVGDTRERVVVTPGAVTVSKQSKALPALAALPSMGTTSAITLAASVTGLRSAASCLSTTLSTELAEENAGRSAQLH